MSGFLKQLLAVLVILAGASLAVMTAVNAYRANGQMGFPLDDPWIHLEFAKNLHQYGSYSYYKDSMVTSGSTSPLYTLLLAAGFFLTADEMLLSYALGILFLLLAALALFALARREFEGGSLPAIAAALLLVVEPRMIWASLSGMETTLFIALLLATYLAYRRGALPLTGALAGVLLWARPEGLIFAAALAADWVYATSVERRSGPRRGSSPPLRLPPRIWPALVLMLALVSAYAAFNLLLSGSVFPNTYAAKIKYYSHGGKNFPEEVFHFLTDGHMGLLAVLAGLGAASVIVRAAMRRPDVQLVPFLWCLGMFCAYWNSLPYLYQEGRYMMPLLPFVILLGITGLETALTWLRKHLPALSGSTGSAAARAAVVGIIAVQSVVASLGNQRQYAEYCRYISDRQVRAAYWIRDHLPADAVVATHDIGAIGFYSGRRIVDMVGLVSPGMIDRIGNLDRLRQFLIAQKATYVAVLRNWFEVVNQNPVYKTDERYPEILEIFPFDARMTHFTPQDVTSATEAARARLSVGDAPGARRILEWAQGADPRSSRVQYLLGVACFASGDLKNAQPPMRRALELHPEYWEVYPMLARAEARSGSPDSALGILESYRMKNPGSPDPYRELAGFYSSVRRDTVKAGEYLRRAQELAPGESAR